MTNLTKKMEKVETTSMILFFENNREYLNKPLSNENINDILYYCSKRWYMPLLKTFGIVIALLVLKYFEKEEDYITCQGILESIENSNRYFGTNYPRTIEDYDMS